MRAAMHMPLENKPLGVALSQLGRVLDDEIAALRAHDHSNIAAMTERKGQCLLELTRRQVPSDVATSDHLRDLREKLATDMRVLATHLRASSEVAALLKQIIAGTEDDGTYRRPMRTLSGSG